MEVLNCARKVAGSDPCAQLAVRMGQFKTQLWSRLAGLSPACLCALELAAANGTARSCMCCTAACAVRMAAMHL